MTSQTHNLSPVDAWSLVHIGTGALAGGIGIPFWVYMILNVGYELFEQVMERQPNNFFGVSGPESGVNAMIDIMVGMGGYAAGQQWLAEPLRPMRKAVFSG